jgi:hypothetical protein
MPYALVGLITLGLWIFCLLDLITCDRAGVRHLPKLVWLPILLLLPAVGCVLWLLVGRPPEEQSRRGEREPATVLAVARTDDDEEFLRQCRERAEAQRREWRRQQRRADES